MKKLNAKFDKVFFMLFAGFLFGFSNFIIMFATFLLAYFSEAKATLVKINDYGEMHLELFLMFLMFDFFVICLIYGWKRLFKEEGIENEANKIKN